LRGKVSYSTKTKPPGSPGGSASDVKIQDLTPSPHDAGVGFFEDVHYLFFRVFPFCHTSCPPWVILTTFNWSGFRGEGQKELALA